MDEKQAQSQLDGLKDDVTALRIAFADELDRLRQDFKKELRILENKLQSQLDDVTKAKDVTISRNKSRSSPQHQLSSWFWPQEFADSCSRAQSPKEEMKVQTSPSEKVAPEVEASRELDEDYLVSLATNVLLEHGPVPIGKMGSLMHKAANDHTLPSLLKERYGGLKKFLQTHQNYFVLGDDHPYNPHVRLASDVKLDTVDHDSNVSLDVSEDSFGRRRRSQRESRGSEASQGSNTDMKFYSSDPPQWTSVIAMDCEMVGVGPDGCRSSLARCSIVNYHGEVIYDKYVRQLEPVTDYRTHVSGIRAEDLVGGEEFMIVQSEVARILRDRVLVGHSLKADLQALGLEHERHLTRDTAYYGCLCPNRPRSLKALVKERLGLNFQSGEHDSVEDARAVLSLYKAVALDWEKALARGHAKARLSVSHSQFAVPPFLQPHLHS